MPHDTPTISTHVLDTAEGRPAPGVRVVLVRGDDVVNEATTDADGRVRDLLDGAPLQVGAYRLEFDLGDGFFRRLAVSLEIDDASRSYHVPLLRSPFGLTTYRGS